MATTFDQVEAAFDAARDALEEVEDSDAPAAARNTARNARKKLESDFLNTIEKKIGQADAVYRQVATQLETVTASISGAGGPVDAVNKLTSIVTAAKTALGPLDG